MSSMVAIVSAFQNTEKLPATIPERMVSDAPPSRVAATISRVCREWLLVKTLVNSGMSAAASVPQEMMVESRHHSPPEKSANIQRDTTKVTTIDNSEVVHTRLVSGASKSILSFPWFCERAIAPLTLNATIDVRIIRMRMTKIHTRNDALCSGTTASAMNEISA